jgi:hypothetical protein
VSTTMTNPNGDRPAPQATDDHRYTLACDIGQSHDYTAVALLQTYKTLVPDREGKHKPERRHDLVHLERFRDLSYPDQVRRVVERYHELVRYAEHAHGDANVRVVVDATGVGKPILDAFREAKLRVRGVIITGGETASSGDGVDRVPKRELVTTLQVALQSKRLRIAEDLPLADALLKEFRGFRVKISLTGHASFGNATEAWREAPHDDLVLAVALATWTAENRPVANLAALRAAYGWGP